MQLVILAAFALTAAAVAVDAQEATPQTAAAAAPPQPMPMAVIVWGTCPQLEPSEEDKKSKSEVLASCLKQFPIPTELTQETINAHQKSVAECALKKENWFEKDGAYKFSKAESEIKKKKLDTNMESELLAAHAVCRDEAKEKIKEKTKVVEQVQLYQSCMDFHITKVCQIKIETKMPK